MRAISSSQLGRTLEATLDQVVADSVPVIITRDGNQPAAVIISLEEYNSIIETDYLLRNPNNAERLRQSIADIKAGRVFERELLE